MGETIGAKELASMLGVHYQTVVGWRKRGVGPTYYNFHGRIRYKLSDVNEWIESNLVRTINE